MPTLIKILTPDGLIPANYQAESLHDATRYEPHDGIYTVTNTYNTYDTLKLDAHFDRMEDSAQRQSIPLNLDRQGVRHALRQMITESGFGDVRFRITVPSATPDQFILTIEPFKPLPATIIQQGVKCITAPNSARQSASAKTTGWMHDREKLEKAMPAGIYDTILLDDKGYLLEGLGANFYAILNGELRTAGEGVLKGIAQQIVFEIAPSIIPVRTDAIHKSEIAQCAEAFITSSSRGIVPVVEMDGIPIGSGQPEAMTQQLLNAYQAWMRDHLVSL